MGVIGITEGAIPFTLQNPVKLMPLNVIASSIGAATAILLGANIKMPPIGGMYGFFSVGNGWAYLVGGLVGAFIIAFGANFLVDFTEKDKEESQTSEEEIEISFN